MFSAMAGRSEQERSRAVINLSLYLASICCRSLLVWTATSAKLTQAAKRVTNTVYLLLRHPLVRAARAVFASIRL
jgi:hypothetical protein